VYFPRSFLEALVNGKRDEFFLFFFDLRNYRKKQNNKNNKKKRVSWLGGEGKRGNTHNQTPLKFQPHKSLELPLLLLCHTGEGDTKEHLASSST
jgi:hypothetical protein